MAKVKDEPPIPPADINLDDILTLIYTSGTTGNPKGVQLSHKNILSNIHGILAVGTDAKGKVVIADKVSLAFLPWAHIYGQTCELHSYLCMGSAMALVNRQGLH